jgi:uncharacterized membrane protein
VYELLKYIHILAAMVWVGGAFTLQIYGIYTARSGDPTAIARFGRDVAVVGGRVFPVASIVLLIAGVIMVLQRWSFGQTWIMVALILWVVSLLVGVLYIGPRSGKVGELFAAEGPTSVAGRTLMNQVFLVARLELVSFAVIVFLMVFKPGAA